MSGSDLQLGAALVSVGATTALSSHGLAFIRAFNLIGLAVEVRLDCTYIVDDLTVAHCCLEVLYYHQDIDAFGLILADRVSGYGVALLLTFNINLEHARLVGFLPRRLVPSLTPTISGRYQPHIDVLFDFASDDDEGLCSSSTLSSTSTTGLDTSRRRLDYRGCLFTRLSSSSLVSFPRFRTLGSAHLFGEQLGSESKSNVRERENVSVEMAVKDDVQPYGRG
ncbi:hypothetical protein BDZ89DRAFT_1144795 [Hymenopellis radicata]|nr:hypothetical protein CPB85DRAFT_1440423 [Mucidula mucida]KAF9006326.1 hypothetical protein BDZ89DRAFT_1144795 [Hymenopellis radicata]